MRDRGVDEAGGADAGPAGERQAGDPRIGAPVERVRLRQQPRDNGGEPLVENGRGEPGIRVDPLRAHPGAGQVEPARPGILPHVAGDVGELHGNAEVAGPGQHLRPPLAHQQRHHGADGAGDPGRIGGQAAEILVEPPLAVPGEAFQQCLWKGTGDAVLRHHGGQGPIGRMRRRCAGIDGVQPVPQPPQRLRAGIEVDCVIGDPAPGVESGRRLGDGARQDTGGGVETLRAAGKQGSAGRQIGFAEHQSGPPERGSRFHRTGAGGSRFRSTRSECKHLLTVGTSAIRWTMLRI